MLETRLVEEEATLDKIDMYTQLMLCESSSAPCPFANVLTVVRCTGSSLAFVLLFSIFLAWWLNRDGVI